MDSNFLIQAPQYFVWLLALLELVLGLYILVLNPWHTANRYSSALLLLIAANGYSIGLLQAANTITQATLPSLALAITSPAIQILLLAASIAILKPSMQRNFGRLLWNGLLLLSVLPAAFALLDARTGTRLWYSGLQGLDYQGGFLELGQYTAGSLSALIHSVSFKVFPALTLLLLLYFALWDRQLARSSRRLARFLFIASLIALAPVYLINQRLVEAAVAIIPNICYAIAYAVAGFRQMVSERRLQRGSLQARLTALSMVVTIPLLVAVSIFVTDQAGALLERRELQSLRAGNRSIALSVNHWLQANARALRQLAAQPDITNMPPDRQQAALQAMVSIDPSLTRVSLVDLSGFDLARSDGSALENHAAQAWYQEAITGNDLAWQIESGMDGAGPTLVAGAPIRAANGRVVGVASLAASLDDLVTRLQSTSSGHAGQYLIVDAQDKLVATTATNGPLPGADLGDYPPLQSLRAAPPSQPITGSMDPLIQEMPSAFSDQSGMKWRSHSILLDNGWAIIVQQPESDLLVNVALFRRLAAGTIGLAIVLLFAMSWITIRQALHPISSLTSTVSAIAQGDLTRVALVESEDEIGLLARTFNTMTSQVRELVTTLERRVTERTRDLEQRALQLQVTAEVASEAAAIRELEQLLRHTVHLISDRFNFYHAGIFLLDETGKYAVLRAASSEGGQRMLAHGHRLEVGQVGIVGYAAGSGEPHIALDVGSDAVFFNNPDLPQTRSEMALPLKVHQRVIGVLDVQSTKSNAFTEDDVTILNTLANQLALAIDNARLLAESQAALEELQELYQQQVAQAWRSRLEHQSLAYHYTRQGVRPADPVELPAEDDARILVAPIQLRRQSLGSLVLRREADQPPWSPDEVEMVRATVAQVALTLENARLLEENRRRALNEQLIGHITARTQSLLDLEAVMKTAVQEIGHALGDAQVQIRLVNGDGASVRPSEPTIPRS